MGVVQELYQTMPEMKRVQEHVQFVALGKGAARSSSGKNAGKSEVLYSIDTQGNIHGEALSYDQTDKLLIQIRDEAHRFANRYRKKQMSMERAPKKNK